MKNSFPKMNKVSSHVLDNPIWNALTTSNQHIASGNKNLKYLKRDVGIFAALRNNQEKELEELHNLVPEGGVILFVPAEIKIPERWRIKLKREILQMTYESKQKTLLDRTGIIQLKDEHIPAMIELTRMTNPGPFFNRTIDFGNYEGIFDGSKLVAMTGRRLQPDPYTEVSAVCTHPDYVGKGYAAKLVRSQVNSIIDISRTPFLHLYPDNTPALKLYEKLGFSLRRSMIVYFLEKNL